MDTLRVKEGSIFQKVTIEAESSNIFDARERAEAKSTELSLQNATGFWDGQKYIIHGEQIIQE